jgi:hypothetical protein
MTALTMNPTLGDLIKSGWDRNVSIDTATVKSGANRLIGTVMAAITVDPTNSGITVTAGTNTGNGTFTKDATAAAQAGVWVGSYTVKIYKAVTNGGEFAVYRPDGSLVGLGSVGVTFNNEIKFAIADGATDFAVGDSWTVAIPAGSGKLVPLVQTAQTDGTHRIHSVLTVDTASASADVSAPVLARGPVAVASDRLIWDASFTTAAQKTAAWANLLALGIVRRSAA